MSAVTGDVAEHLEHHLPRIACLGANTRAVNILEVGESRPRRERQPVNRRGIPRAFQNQLVTFPIIHIGLRQAKRNLAVLGDVGVNQQLVRRRNIPHIRRIGISRPYEKRNGRPAEFLVFAKPHHASETLYTVFLETVLRLTRQRVRITESRRIVLRIGPGPATTSNHVKRIMRQHIVGIVLPRHKNEQEHIRFQFHITEFPLKRLRL